MRAYETARLQQAAAAIARRHPETTSVASLAYEASVLEAAAAIVAREARATGPLSRVIFRMCIRMLLVLAADLQRRIFISGS